MTSFSLATVRPLTLHPKHSDPRPTRPLTLHPLAACLNPRACIRTACLHPHCLHPHCLHPRPPPPARTRAALSPLGLLGAFTVVVALGVMLSSDQIDARAHPFLRRLCRCRRDNATVSLLHPAAGAQTMVAPPHGGTRASAGRLPAEVSSGAVDAEQGGRVLERPS